MKASKIKFLLLFSVVLFVIIVILAFDSPGIETHETKRLINSPKEVVWSVISDIENYHKYTTGLTGVTIISGEGEGMIRACSDPDNTWTETCTKWEEGSSYAFSVNTESGFPFPFDVFNGTWLLEGRNENKTTITIRFEYQFTYRWMNWMFSSDTHLAIEEGNEILLDNWEKEIRIRKLNIHSLLNSALKYNEIEITK